MVRVFGSVRSNNASVLDSNLAVPDARSSLELVRTCHQDLQYLISLRNDKLDLLNREPRVLERVNSIIEVATQGLTAACSLVEKCRPEAHSGKLPMHSRMAWRLRDSAAFREQEPIIRRSHTSVLSEISFIRQVILAESMVSKNKSPETERAPPGKQAEFDNIALLDGLMADGSVSTNVHNQAATTSPTLCQAPIPVSRRRLMSFSNWPEAVHPGAPAVPASPVRANVQPAEPSTTPEASQLPSSGCCSQAKRPLPSLTNALRRKPCPGLHPNIACETSNDITTPPMQMRPRAPLLRQPPTPKQTSHRVFRRLCHSDSQIDLISSIIHEEDEDLEELSPRELDWTPVSSDDLDMLRARDFVSPLGSILSYDFSVSSMQSSQPTRNSTSVGGQCPRRRVISRQYSLPVMSADILGSSLMSSMPHEWIHTENGAEAERLDNNTNRGNCEDPDDSDEPTQPRQSSISKRKRLSRRLSDTDVNAHVTARWAQESIDMFIPTPGDLTNAEAGLEDHQPPPPYQEELRTGEIDFSFLDELCHGSIPSSQAGTVNNEIYELP